jgi:hypothetical protein
MRLGRVLPMRPARVAFVVASLAALGASTIGCVSPESVRTRGGGPGADIGNRRATVVFHQGAVMYYHTPCATKVECKGPPAVFGKTWKPD